MLRVPNYYGVKTGITEAAGPCLSAYYENESNAYIIVLLSSKSRQARWGEVTTLVNWALNQKPSILSNYGPTSFNKKDNLTFSEAGTHYSKASTMNLDPNDRGRSLSIHDRKIMMSSKQIMSNKDSNLN